MISDLPRFPYWPQPPNQHALTAMVLDSDHPQKAAHRAWLWASAWVHVLDTGTYRRRWTECMDRAQMLGAVAFYQLEPAVCRELGKEP